MKLNRNQYLRLTVLSTIFLSLSIFADTKDKIKSPPPTPQSPPTACMQDSHYDDFNFWIGDWDVYDSKNNLVGTNFIEKKFTNCLVTESWLSSNKIPGFSTNYYNPVTKQWVQRWVSNGVIAEYAGGLVDDSMVLEGTIYYHATKIKAPFKGTWTLL